MIISKELEAYTSLYSSALDPLLQEICDFTIANHPCAQMLSSKEQGLLLQFISRITQPKRILEIGTFTGFSGLCLASGLAENGELHTLELRSEDAATAQSYFDRSTSKQKIHLHIGNASQIIPTLHEQWDMVFIDADKTGYINYYELVLPNLKPNGLILVDNVLYDGEVLNDPITGKNPKAIAAFNEMVKNDTRVEQVILTVRDGLSLIRKRM